MSILRSKILNAGFTAQLWAIILIFLSLAAFSIIPASADSISSPGTTIETQWVPSGPASHTISYNYYAGEDGEFAALQASQIDLTDTPLNKNNVPQFCPNSAFWCTGTPPNPPDPGYSFQHNDFNLANQFWGLTFCFGQDNIVAGGPCQPNHGSTTVPGYPYTTATCPNVPAPHSGDCTYAGIQWREGFAQLLNKRGMLTTVFGGAAQALDNLGTVPAQNQRHSGLPFDLATGTSGTCEPTPNIGQAGCVGAYNTGAPANFPIGGVCTWDTLHTTAATGSSNCTSALNYPGTNPSADGITWDAGSTNFCDAADHYVAAGIASGKDANCRLITLQGPGGDVQFVVRQDVPGMLSTGTAIFNRFCDLLNAPLQLLGVRPGSRCSRATNTGATLSLTLFPLTTTICCPFPIQGGSTDGVNINTPRLDWWLYTGRSSGTPKFDQQYFLYDSLFASRICGGTSSTTVTQMLANYVYSCNANMDHYEKMVESNATATGAAQALQVAMEIFGNHTISVATVSRTQQFAYLKGWQGVSDATGVGIATGNSFSLLNAWNPNSGGTIRWGQKLGTSRLNPFIFTTVQEENVIQEVYDSLLTFSPYVPSTGAQVFGYVANSFSLVSHSAGVPGTTVDTNCPAAVGVFPVQGCIKFVLRGDISFQDGTQVTASDVKFSIENYNATGGIVSPGTLNTVDVVFDPKVLPTSMGGTQAPGQSEILYAALQSVSVFATLDYTGLPIVPQHLWRTGAPGSPTPSAAAVCADTGLGASQVGNGKNTPQCTVDPSFLTDPVLSDPVTSNRFIGSGGFECTSPDGSVVGGGCTATGSSAVGVGNGLTLTRFGSGLSPQGPTGSAVGSVYFRSNADYKQFLWAAAGSHTPGEVDGFAFAADLACPTTITPNFCTQYNGPDAVVTCVSSAGACNGSPAGGAGLANPTHSDFVGYASQIVRWSGTFWSSPFAYASLDGAIPAPVTVYEDGSQYT